MNRAQFEYRCRLLAERERTRARDAVLCHADINLQSALAALAAAKLRCACSDSHLLTTLEQAEAEIAAARSVLIKFFDNPTEA